MEYLTARGGTPAEAREEALRRFSDVEQYRHDCRSADERRAGREHRKENLSVLKQDIRFALRSLRRQPAFTAIVVITLALGIGANTAIFSVIDSVMLAPLPYHEPHQLVMLWETRPGGDRPLVSYRKGDQNPDVVLPVGLFATDAPYNRRGQPDLFAVGRLKPGVTVEQALSDLQRVSAELRAEYPRENLGLGAAGAPMMDMVVRFIKPALQVLMAAVALVLLIACANVSSLVLSRSAARQREFALRTALGAARGRIVRQVLTESVVLALAGGALGVGIAVAGVRLLVTLQRGAPRVADSHVNTPVLLFALGVSLLTGLLFGLAPALQSGSAQLVSALKESGRGTSGGASLQRTRAALTVAEVALAVMLLAGSGLLVRSFAKLTAVDPGFQPSHVIAGAVRLSSAKYPGVEQARVTLDQLLAKVRAIPGVESAALGSDLPICCQGQSTISFASRPEADQSKLALLNVAVVDPEYFETLQIPVVGGRHIETGDRAGAPLVALVSERVAQKFFAGASPIGERLRLGGSGQVNDTRSWRTIVGVVRDTRTDGLTEAPRGTLYLPRAQGAMRGAG